MQIVAKHRPFKTTAEDFMNSNPMFAYYFYKYYVSVIKPIYEETQEPAAKAELENEVKETFKIMNGLASQGQNPNDEENMKVLLEYTELMFAKNDHFHQEGYFTKQIAEVQIDVGRTTSLFTGCMR